MAQPTETTLITHTPKILSCNISEFCRVVLEKLFKGLYKICYVQIAFGYYFANNVIGTTITFEQTLITQIQRLFACNRNSAEQFWRKKFKTCFTFTLQLLCSNCVWRRSSFGEEDLQRFALNLLFSNYFVNNVGGATI